MTQCPIAQTVANAIIHLDARYSKLPYMEIDFTDYESLNRQIESEFRRLDAVSLMWFDDTPMGKLCLIQTDLTSPFKFEAVRYANRLHHLGGSNPDHWRTFMDYHERGIKATIEMWDAITV